MPIKPTRAQYEKKVSALLKKVPTKKTVFKAKKTTLRKTPAKRTAVMQYGVDVKFMGAWLRVKTLSSFAAAKALAVKGEKNHGSVWRVIDEPKKKESW